MRATRTAQGHFGGVQQRVLRHDERAEEAADHGQRGDELEHRREVQPMEGGQRRHHELRRLGQRTLEPSRREAREKLLVDFQHKLQQSHTRISPRMPTTDPHRPGTASIRAT
jgi:hypothetical protein